MSKLPLSGLVNGSEIFFIAMLGQFALALWLSHRCHRDEPHWQTLSLLGSLLLPGLPGFLFIRLLRSRCRAYVESLTRTTGSPQG
ncbi:MAG: hypothetical protein KF712_04695 [Akkermansiaceae bacterium]|nr:hypothetical protein [Akkermansiaceae bacterium]